MAFGKKHYRTPKNRSLTARRSDAQLDLPKRRIRKEAYLGGRIFGQLNRHQRREFFCLDDKTWIWHESWRDKTTKRRCAFVLRYDIGPDQMYKRQDDDSASRRLDAGEAANLRAAIDIYRSEILAKLYPGRKPQP